MFRPGRDGRFHYCHEIIHYLEERQCESCVFRNTDDPEEPMCHPIAGNIVLEEPVEEINDLGIEGIVCTKYRKGDPTPPQVEGQEALF